ncbi:MAG: hypothetical protein QW156_05080 [Candidatus Aenigmatarchaeota archaeon]
MSTIYDTMIYYQIGILQQLKALENGLVIGDSNLTAYIITLTPNVVTKIKECSGRQKGIILRLKNLDFTFNRPVYLGDKMVSSTKGYPVYPNETEEIIIFSNMTLYGVVTSGTTNLSLAILERG